MNKTQERQVLHITAAHYSLTDALLIPEQQLEPPSQLPSVYTLNMTFCSMEYPFGQFGSALPDCASSWFLMHLLTGRA